MNDLDTLLLSLPVNPSPDVQKAFLENTFSKLGEEEYRTMIGSVVPGMRSAYGIRLPQLRALARGMLKRMCVTPEMLVGLVEAAWSGPTREHRQIALLLAAYSKISAGERWALAKRFIPDIGNWEECDQLCLSLTTPALSQEFARFDELEGWAAAENFWRRRVALVTVAILRKPYFSEAEAEQVDERTLRMCLHLLDDPEPYVAKAVDWAVREVLKRRYATGCRWMFERLAGSLSRTARSTLRKASAKLSPEDASRFLAGLTRN